MAIRKPRRIPATRKQSAGGFMLGMFVGLIAGLAVSLAIAFYLNKTPVPFLTAKAKQSEKDAAAGKAPAIAGLPQGAVAAAPAEKPRFDFYKILPGQEEPVSERELRDRMKSGRGQQDGPKDVYFIQAGSFQNPADADNQKARLAILGFESSVEPANLPDKGTWYRVRLGPYNKLDEINRIRQSLAQNNIDASLVKIKEQP
ncbi:MAG: SPOR domain-containing protein [Burkholderiales bacterium]